jgi:outer membrane protein
MCMKKLFFCVTFLCGSSLMFAAAQDIQPAKIGMVSFKKCVEESKAGKKEQAQFDVQRKEMEQTLEKKQKDLNELAPKFNEEYLDSLTPEAEKQLKDKFQTLSQELTELQNQYYQAMDQTHYQLMQKLYDMVGKAAEVVAKDRKLDFVLNDEVCFYKNATSDVSADVIKKLDEMFEKAEKEKK